MTLEDDLNRQDRGDEYIPLDRDGSLVDLAYEILRRRGKPLAYKEITEELLKIRPFIGENPYQAVNIALSGDKRFLSVDKGVWGLTKWLYAGETLKYTLTSLCSRNGFIYLAKYLRPFFPKEPARVPITLIDDEDNEFTVVVDNHRGYIYGLKDFYTKTNLEANDVIYLSIIDYELKRYQISIEPKKEFKKKDNLLTPLKNLLKSSGKPIGLEEMTENISRDSEETKEDLKPLIESILKSNEIFIQGEDNTWLLRDKSYSAQKVYQDLSLSQFEVEEAEQFKGSLKNGFSFLGFDVEIKNFEGRKMLILTSPSPAVEYRVLVDAEVVPESMSLTDYEHWDKLKRAVETEKAEFSALVSSQFEGQKLADKAYEAKVSLLRTEGLLRIIKAHEDISFSLLDLKRLFIKPGNVDSEVDNLLRKKANIDRKVKLLSLILKRSRDIFAQQGQTTVEKLVQELGVEFEAGAYRVNEVEEILELLSIEPLRIFAKTRKGSYLVIVEPEILIRRLSAILDRLKSEFNIK